eukprot:tig00020734_g13605.t1
MHEKAVVVDQAPLPPPPAPLPPRPPPGLRQAKASNSSELIAGGAVRPGRAQEVAFLGGADLNFGQAPRLSARAPPPPLFLLEPRRAEAGACAGRWDTAGHALADERSLTWPGAPPPRPAPPLPPRPVPGPLCMRPARQPARRH